MLEMFFCCARSPSANISKRFCTVFTTILTLTTSTLLFICLFTDNWDEIEYNFNDILNDNSVFKNPCVNVTNLSSNGLLIKTAIPNADGSCGTEIVGNVIVPENGGIWRNCFVVNDNLWSTVMHECYPQPDRCSYYLGNMSSFCCNRCQYTEQEFKDLDDQVGTSYGTHFSAISFVIVALLLHCVCYILISIVIFRRVVPVVMMTGIIFVLSAAFLTFALAANAYKISSMNSKHWVLPHVSSVMVNHRKVREGWSMTIGWCAVLFSCFSSVTWIKLSYQLASVSNKIKPLVASPVQQPTILVDVDPVTNGVGVNGGITTKADRMVQWAKRRASHAARKSIPNGAPQGNLMEGHF